MEIVKKHALRIVLIIILVLTGALSIYTTVNYNKRENTNANVQLNGFNQMHNNQNSMPNFGVLNQNSKNGKQSQVGQPPQNGKKPQMTKQPQNGKQLQIGQPPPNRKQPQMGQQSQNNFMQIGNVSNSSNTKSEPYLIAYSIMFFIVFVLIYYYFIHKGKKINPGNYKILIFALLAIGFLLRISLGTVIEGHPGDINIFKGWASTAANNLTKFYSNSMMSDYPPLYMYVLFVVGKIAQISVLNKYFILLLKLPSILADIGTAYLIYKIAKKRFSSEISIFLSAFYIYNPAIFINSTCWGQVDSFFALIISIAVYLLSEKKLELSSAAFTIAVLMKPQGIIFLPVLFFELVRQKKIKNFIKSGVIAVITAIIIIIPFSANQDIFWIFKLYKSTVSEYPYATLNAFNFFYFIDGNFVSDTSKLLVFSYHNWGMIFIVLTTLISWILYIKCNDSKFAIAAALIQIAGVFTFSVGMHERYLFPAVVLSILTFIKFEDKRILLLMMGFSATVYLNTHMVLFEALKGNLNALTYSPIMELASMLNIAMFIYLVKIVFDIAVKKAIKK